LIERSLQSRSGRLEESAARRHHESEQERVDMSTSANKELMQQIFADMAHGNARPFVAAMADDVRWTILGSSKWCRTYEGKGAVLTELWAPLQAHMVEPIRLIAERVIGDGELVVVEARGHNVTKSGTRYDNAYCFIVRLVDGKIRELTEYMDTALANAVLDPAGAPAASG
jgi:ketosteroid isomerase-like protein